MSSRFCTRFKQLRLEKELKQEELVNEFNKKYHFNFTRAAISQYENDKRIPEIDALQSFADYFNVTVDYLLGRTDIKNPIESDPKIDIPKEYTDKYKVTTRDKKQYQEEMKKANEAFFMNDELSDEAKKEMLDLMSQLFWEAKALNKRPKDK